MAGTAIAGAACVRVLLVGQGGGAFAQAARIAQAMGARVTLACEVQQALHALRAHGADLAMIDVTLDVAGFIATLRREHFLLPVLGCGIAVSATLAVAAIRAGAADYVPLPPDAEMIGAALASVALPVHEIVGEAPAFLAARRFAEAITPSLLPLLFVGEAGAGKQAMARHAHDASGRTGPFVVLACDGGSEAEIASELFGHSTDAFPGAVARSGALDAARHGSLLLRDVDALPRDLQRRLAHHLVAPANQPAHGAARVMATLRGSDPLYGRLHAELAHLLSVANVRCPPLRERRGDIALLARHFARQAGSTLDDAALDTLDRYDWPDNVRELELVIRRAAALSPAPHIGASSLCRADGGPLEAAPPGAAHDGGTAGTSVADMERALILRTLDSQRGNRTAASAILGISVRTMRNKLKSFAEAGYPVAPSQFGQGA